MGKELRHLAVTCSSALSPQRRTTPLLELFHLVQIILEKTLPENCSKLRSPFMEFCRSLQTLIVIALMASAPFASCGFNKQRALWRADGRCGRGFLLSTTLMAAQCDPNSERPCCSDYGYCGNSPFHCSCSTCIDFREVAQEEECDSHNKETGYFESPNYPRSYNTGQDCCYDIERTSDDFCGISLTVEELDVGRPEERGFCRRDWLSLPSCAPEEETRICGNKTGQYYQYLFQPSSTAIRLRFHAGKFNENRKGFRIKYHLLKVCPGPYQTQDIPVTEISGTSGTRCYTKITDNRGTINSPFYPEAYPNNLECVYEFVRSDYNICGIRMQTVRFVTDEPIQTPFGGACEDFLHTPSCGFICGSVNFTWVVQFQPGASGLKFHFHSGTNSTAKGDTGFLINFQYTKKC